jgi:arsenate reductase
MALSEGPDDLLLLHNPRCSKSRALEAALVERGVPFRVRRYLDEPLDRAEVQELFERLDRPALECVRPKEDEFAAAGLGPDSTAEEVMTAVVGFPKLLERPVLVRGERAAIGRPTEAALALLG